MLLVLVVIVDTSDGAPPLIDSSDANEAANAFVGNMAFSDARFSEADQEQGLFEMDAQIGKAKAREKKALENAKAEAKKTWKTAKAEAKTKEKAWRAANAEAEKVKVKAEEERAKKIKLSRVKAPGCYDLFTKRLLVWC